MSNTYWEYYDDQTSEGFQSLEYIDRLGKIVTRPVENDLESQVNEIRRVNGANTDIKLIGESH